MCALLLLAALASTAGGLAQGSGRVALAVQAGFDGFCKRGSWMPVRALVTNAGPGLAARLEVRINAGVQGEAIYAREVSLPTNSRKEIFLYVYPGDAFIDELSVRLLAEGIETGRAQAPLNCLAAGDVLFGVLAENLSAFNLLADLDPPEGIARVAHLELADLPDNAAALGALNTLVIAGVDTGRLTSRQQGALAGWVSAGGTLVAAGGAGWQPVTAGLGELAGRLPIQPGEVRRLDQSAPSGDSAGTDGALLDFPRDTLVATGLSQQGAQALASYSGVTLAARRAYGRGELLFLAFDPSQEPARSWPGLGAFFQVLPGFPRLATIAGGGFQDWTQAAQAATTIPGLRLPPAGWVIGFLGIYVFTVGPLNYLLLRRLERRELSWLSIPGLVVVFSLAAFLVGRGVRGARPVLNRLAVVQGWAGSGYAQVSGLVGLFSPSRGTYQVEAGPGFLAHPIPGANRAARDALVFVQAESGGTRLPGLRVDAGAVQSFALQGEAGTGDWSSDLTLQVGRQGAVLAGTLTLPVELALQGAVLLAPGTTQQLGELQPGETRAIGLSLDATSRAAYDPAEPPDNQPMMFMPAVPGFTDLLGTSDFYRSREIYHRFMLLSAFFGQGQNAAVQKAPFTLAGWSERSPLDAAVTGGEFDTADTTLYLLTLEPGFQLSPGPLGLPPGLFTWSILEPGLQAGAAPYETTVNPGGFSLRFRPLVDVENRAVAALTLRLESYGATGPAALQVQLWDFAREAWQRLPDAIWGENPVPGAASFIGPGGEIRLRLLNADLIGPVQLERADFVLQVEGKR